jgi:hypothetical protein
MVRLEIKSDSQIKFDKARHSLVWTCASIEDAQTETFHTFEFVFNNTSDEMNFKKTLAIKIFEASRQESFEEVIESVTDKDWVIHAYEADAHEYESSEDGNYISFYNFSHASIDNEMDFDENKDLSRPALRTPSKNEDVHNSHLAVG